MKFLSRSFLIILLFLSVSCKQDRTDKPSEEDENNAKNFELSSKTESDDIIMSAENGSSLNALEVKELIRENPGLIIIDVRTPAEFQSGRVENAINLDIYSPNFIKNIKGLKKGEKYLLYCSVGGRSSAALELMRKQGFSSVFNSKKGFSSLKEVGITTKE